MSTSEIYVVDSRATLASETHFVDPVLNLLRAMNLKGLTSNKFNTNVIFSPTPQELLGKVTEFIACTESSFTKIMGYTHSLNATDLPSAARHTKVLLKECRKFGADAMVKYCGLLKGNCSAGNTNGAREALEMLIEKYDQLKQSLIQLLELQNIKLVFSTEQAIYMDLYQKCIDQIGSSWMLDQLAATNAEITAEQDALLVQQAQAADQAAKKELAEAELILAARREIFRQAKAAAEAQKRKLRASKDERIRKVAIADGPSADPRRRSFGGGPCDAVPCLRRGLSVVGSRREITGDNRPPKKGLSSIGCVPSSKCCIM